jgi:hypothetical protein
MIYGKSCIQYLQLKETDNTVKIPANLISNSLMSVMLKCLCNNEDMLMKSKNQSIKIYSI